MTNKSIIVLLICILAAAVCGTAYAEGPYTFELVEGASYSEKNENWYIDLSVPEIRGMADEEKQKELNDNFIAVMEETITDYKRDAAFAEESLKEGNAPHFGYEMTFETVVDSDEYFVFKTSWFMAAGSSMTVNEYYTLSKINGELVDFDDVVTTEEEMVSIRNQIFAEMKRINENEEGMYWTEDDTLDISLGQVEYLRHWYINEDGNLVITFDKYEIAPGAMGTSEFVIDANHQDA